MGSWIKYTYTEPETRGSNDVTESPRLIKQASYLSRIVGQKKAREIWFLCRQYDAEEALQMGLVNVVVPLSELEDTTIQWCREMLAHSPLALRCLILSEHRHRQAHTACGQRQVRTG